MNLPTETPNAYGFMEPPRTRHGMDFNLHAAIAPALAELGFELQNKQFRGRSGSIPMTVWFNPENRLKRIRTISVDCGMPGDAVVTGEPLYVFDQAHAATRDWRAFYSPGSAGWPDAMVEDFRAFTVPFIQKATSGEALLDLLLAGDSPPQHGRPATGIPIFALRISMRLQLPQYEGRVVDYIENQRYTCAEFREIRSWAHEQGLPRVRLRIPLPARFLVPRGAP